MNTYHKNHISPRCQADCKSQSFCMKRLAKSCLMLTEQYINNDSKVFCRCLCIDNVLGFWFIILQNLALWLAISFWNRKLCSHQEMSEPIKTRIFCVFIGLYGDSRQNKSIFWFVLQTLSYLFTKNSLYHSRKQYTDQTFFMLPFLPDLWSSNNWRMYSWLKNFFASSLWNMVLTCW